MTEASVTYKVLRTAYDSRWYPSFYWDWFYGPGYWWYAYDYPWYPGWETWGCRKPLWEWWPRGQTRQPEVVAEGEKIVERLTKEAEAKAEAEASDESETEENAS